MNLVMFRFAVEHISKVARILKLENGNAMLIGIGGGGRQSCSRMATYLADYDIFQIVIAKGTFMLFGCVLDCLCGNAC